jgi:hypothetical protein
METLVNSAVGDGVDMGTSYGVRLIRLGFEINPICPIPEMANESIHGKFPRSASQLRP